MGASDIGTGTKTVMAMVVSEELGVPLKKIQIEHADTGTTQYATPSGGSKTVPTESPAVRAASIHVKQQLLEMASQELKVGISDLIFSDGDVVSWSDPSKKIKVDRYPRISKTRPHPGGWLSRSQPGRQGREPLCRSILRGGGQYEDRRGEDPPFPECQRQRPGDEPADLREPGIWWNHDGDWSWDDRDPGPRRRSDGQDRDQELA